MLMSIFAALPMQVSAAAKTDINDLRWTTPKNAYYTPNYKPAWSFSIYDKARDHKLHYGDITVTYSSLKVGHCVATFKGRGNYTGTKYVQFTVLPRPLSYCSINMQTRFQYNGIYRTPEVTIMNGNFELVEDKDYTISYSGPENGVGKGKVTIKGKNNYTGTATRYYTVYVGKPKLYSCKRADSKTVSFSWSKVLMCSGYEVQKKKNSGSWGSVFLTDFEKTKYVDKATRNGTKYTYRVRAYVKDGRTGKMTFSEWLGPYEVY